MGMLRQLTNPLGLQLAADDEVLRLAGMVTGSYSPASRDSRLHRNLVLVAEIERKLVKIRIRGSVPFGFLPGNALHFRCKVNWLLNEIAILRQVRLSGGGHEMCERLALCGSTCRLLAAEPF
jgi:hypothetical protein